MSAIEAIVGLGNPGERYANTRHNVGQWFLAHLSEAYHFSFKQEPKLKGQLARFTLNEHDIRVFMPNTYMNESGQAVKAFLNFYKIPVAHMLVVHDELDLPSGMIKLKTDGGHGGHNGLRSLMSHLDGNTGFHRLRIGIGHPGHRDLVTDYVLCKPSKADEQKIHLAIEKSTDCFSDLFAGNLARAMNTLHEKG